MKAISITVLLSNGTLQAKKLYLGLLLTELELLFEDYLIYYEESSERKMYIYCYVKQGLYIFMTSPNLL